MDPLSHRGVVHLQPAQRRVLTRSMSASLEAPAAARAAATLRGEKTPFVNPPRYVLRLVCSAGC